MAIDLVALKAEIDTDPLGRVYSAMTDDEVQIDMNLLIRDLARGSITGDEAFSVTDSTQFGALTDTQRDLWMSFCGRAVIDPFGAANVAFMVFLFGAGTAAITALNTLRQGANGQSRATELGLWPVTVANVAAARALV